jgi:hypothetical protein
MNDHECSNGWLFESSADGHQRARRCPKCASRAFLQRIGREDCTWKTWEDMPALADQVALLREWKGKFPWSVLLHAEKGEANFGAGKTHAVIATAVEWIERGRDVQYWFVPDLVDQCRHAIADNSMNLSTFGEYKHLVVFDDLGAEARTDWTRELIDRVLDLRYRRSLPTLIASNLDLVSLEDRYPRALSRMCEGLRLVWNAPDRRREF